MRKALETQWERVSVLSSPAPQRSVPSAAMRLLLGRKRYPLWMTGTALRAYAKRLEEAVAQQRPDAVLCISSQHLIYAKDLGVPVYMVSDAPWMAYKQAYQAYERLPVLAKTYAALEANAAKRSLGVVYPTPWACVEARTRFGMDASKIHLLPFGANSFCADTDEQVWTRIDERTLQSPKFLFIGKDWERKGGPLAVRVVQELNARGIRATLDIIGCQPQIDATSAAHVRLLGYLSPDKPDDRATMAQAFRNADFFLVPSYAECFGLVFAEAQSYGLPCISLTSQGIPGVVDDTVTGLLFAPTALAKQMAERTHTLLQDRAAYRQMALAARAKYSRELNWTSFGAGMHHLISKR